MKKILGALLSLLICIISLFILLKPLTSMPENSEVHDKTRFHDLFNNDNEEYIGYIQNNVSFETIDLSIVTVVMGDNFWKIAKTHGVNIDTLIGANPNWKSLIARVNQKIVVPSEKGTLHFIKHFDELENLPELYEVNREDIIVQDLPFMYRAYYRFLDSRDPVAVFIRDAKPNTTYMDESLAQQYELREKFRSPLGGRFSSLFGSRRHPIFHKKKFHNGVDIAAPYGTYVGASRAGRVIATGWMGGYGKAVIIRHKNGYRTLYGHLSKILTRKGRYVKSGSLIGKVGSTGYSTGPHLHFTLWHRGKLINPLKVLW